MVNTWENCWTEDGEPLTFTSRAHAQAEIDELLDEMPEYAHAHYRIVEVQHG